jgi:Transcriptional regulators
MSATLSPIKLTHGTILSDEVYSCIGAAILDGRLRPGQRLRDVDLAAELGISRTPVREALQRLERLGLVEVAVGRYTRVSEPGEQLRADTAVFTVLTLGNALRLALASCCDDQLRAIVAAADAAAAAARLRDELALFDAMTSLFRLVVEATGNGMFISVMQETSLVILRNLRGWSAFVEAPLRQPEAYERLRDSIARRDGAGAESIVRSLHGLA